MRFMFIVKANADTPAGVMPPPALLAAMDAFHEELARAGALLDGAGLKASAHAWRVAISGDGRRRIIDGLFAGPQEMIAGYTLIQARSREEALEWSRRFPSPRLQGCACEIEVHPLLETADLALSDD